MLSGCKSQKFHKKIINLGSLQKVREGGSGKYTYRTNFTTKANFPNECYAHRKREFQKTEKDTMHMLTNIYILDKKYKNNYKNINKCRNPLVHFTFSRLDSQARHTSVCFYLNRHWLCVTAK